jgi:hypothetical protein
VAQALAAARPSGGRPGRLTAALPSRSGHTTAGVVSLPGLTASRSRRRSHSSLAGPGTHLGRVALWETVRWDRGVYQGRATHVVRPFVNKSG